jgi:hypothetical protein
VGLLLIANTVNIGADIGAMVASLQLLVPINFIAGVVLLTVAITALEILVPYHRYSKILKWLTISLAAYIITGFIIKPDWVAVIRSVAVPQIRLDSGYLAAMVAVMGTTITPYLFFWQASEEVEQERDEGELGDFRTTALTHEIREMRKDTYTGMALANVVFLFIVVTTAFVLHEHGITNVDSAQKAAMALKPLAGNLACGTARRTRPRGRLGVRRCRALRLAGGTQRALRQGTGVLPRHRRVDGRRDAAELRRHQPDQGALLCGDRERDDRADPDVVHLQDRTRQEGDGPVHEPVVGEYVGMGRDPAHGRKRYRARRVRDLGEVAKRLRDLLATH